MKQQNSKEAAENKANGKAADPMRRSFLASAACAPVVAAGVLLAKRSPVPEPPAPAAGAPPGNASGSVGYHETEHTRKYYRTLASI